MPLFGRKPKLPPPSAELPSGEEVERATKATLLYGKEHKKGVLHMTNRRLMFEAAKGDAKWMIVPYGEIKSAGLHPAPSATMGRPSSGHQCLVVVTRENEQIWWDFNDREERDWLPLVQSKLSEHQADADDDSA